MRNRDIESLRAINVQAVNFKNLNKCIGFANEKTCIKTLRKLVNFFESTEKNNFS